jgi:hypothetical protein
MSEPEDMGYGQPITVQQKVTQNGKVDQNIIAKAKLKVKMGTAGVAGNVDDSQWDINAFQLVCSMKGEEGSTDTDTDIKVVPTPVGWGKNGMSKEALTRLIKKVYISTGRYRGQGFDGDVSLLTGVGSCTIMNFGRHNIRRGDRCRVIIDPNALIPCHIPEEFPSGFVPFQLEPVNKNDPTCVEDAYKVSFGTDPATTRFAKENSAAVEFAHVLATSASATLLTGLITLARAGVISFRHEKLRDLEQDEQEALLAKNLLPHYVGGALSPEESITIPKGQIFEVLLRALYAHDNDSRLYMPNTHSVMRGAGMGFETAIQREVASAQVNNFTELTAGIRQVDYDVTRTACIEALSDAAPGKTIDVMLIPV